MMRIIIPECPMNIRPSLALSAFLLLLGACREGETKVDTDDDAVEDDAWEELEESDDDGKSDTGDGGDKEDGVCGDEVEADAPCEGTWEETLCEDEDGTWWWCEGGVWTADKE